jgi:hypothetical protein
MGDVQGAFYYGVVTAVPGANQFTIDGLAGYGETAFSSWYAYVFWDAGGAGAAPQEEYQQLISYTNLGVFETGGFTAAVDVGDIILVIHPLLYELLNEIFNIQTDTGDILSNQAILLDMEAEGRLPSLSETWQEETGISEDLWLLTQPATGTPWARTAAGAYLEASCIPALNETARMVSTMRWIVAPDTYGDNTVIRKMVFEFSMKLTNVANLDNTLCFFGLTPGQADTRATNGIAGFALLADALQTVTDDAGAETVNTGFGETLTNWNKFRMEIYAGHVKFFLNGTQIADHAANLPDAPAYIDFYFDTEAGGTATPEIGILRAWYETVARA